MFTLAQKRKIIIHYAHEAIANIQRKFSLFLNKIELNIDKYVNSLIIWHLNCVYELAAPAVVTCHILEQKQLRSISEHASWNINKEQL